MKNIIRQINKQKRSIMTKEDVAEKSIIACQNLLSDKFYKDAGVIMLYMPLGNETDTTAVLEHALNDGKKVAVPVTDKENADITPCVIDKETIFDRGAFSILEPQMLCVADEDEIDIVIVPGIAFDRSGARVGFGKGCYDRFLTKTHALKVGLCYDFQLVDHIPRDSHDVLMDYVVTDKEICKVK